jgi:predicted permease
VRTVFASGLIPIDGGGGGGPVEFEGRPVEPRLRPNIRVIGVTPGFHRTLGATMARGRDFTESEGWSKAPVAVINQAMAKRFWPDGDALDKRFRLVLLSGAQDWLTIIGIAPDLELFGIDPQDGEPQAAAFMPYGYGEAFSTGLTIRVETGDPAAVTASVREAIRASDPTLPLYFVRTMEEVRRGEFWGYALYGWIFGAIGVAGLLLAAAGVYGVVSYSVAQRTQELGVRMAMGAERGDVLRLVVGQGLLLTGVGVALGLGLAAAGMPVARSLLYKVSPFDPISFGSVAVFLIAAALVASYVPALRATRVDPVVALRGE